MKNCTFCGGLTEEREIDVTKNWKGRKVTFHGIKALVCIECGEGSFAPGDVKLMETVMESEALPFDEEQLLNVKDVAGYLRVSLQTVYNMLRTGRLTAVKVGREWRFPKERVIRALRLENEKGAPIHPALAAASFRKNGDLTEDDKDKLFTHMLDALEAYNNERR